MTIVDCDQRSEEWFLARAGRLTGSVAGDVLSFIKSGAESAARRDLRLKLACERITGRPEENGFVNEIMQRGIDCEPMARHAYETETGDLVTMTGFIAHDSLMAGCSLDGHIGNFERLVSFKCPKSATQLSYIKAGKMPASYVPQMLHELWITGAQAYDFYSWDDRLPPGLRTFFVRTLRASVATDIQNYETAAKAFLSELDTEVAEVQKLVRDKEPAF